ncbi:TIR domain-containing protein [Sedimenticola selenatireducens]|uniref:TIR domain-containing protein n=1 Tax=Sedimenticola selenatireducens TaxID=191960 RepID=UPI0004B4788F|nr:TIR domain-containing protein [Sedimenticola selenatireducens]
MDGIFISYRREDSAGYAGRLYDRLAAHFGVERVFMDVEGIAPGTDFVDAIERAVTSCKVLIVLIGNEWTGIVDGSGRRRLDDPNDFIRLETSTALKRDIRVVPVLLEGAQMPRVDELPDELSSLSRRQAIEISHKQWEASTGNLIEALDKIYFPDTSTVTPQVTTTTGQEDSSRSHAKRWGPWLAVGLVGVALAGAWVATRWLMPEETFTATPVAPITRPAEVPIAALEHKPESAQLSGAEPEPEATSAPEPEPVAEPEPAPSLETEPEPVQLVGRLDVQPHRIDYGTITLGASGMASITLTNSGDADLAAPRIGGVEAADITLDNRCPDKLVPDESCVVGLRFEPRRAGPLNIELSIGRVDDTPITILLTGKVVEKTLPVPSTPIVESTPPPAKPPPEPPKASPPPAPKILNFTSKVSGSAAELCYRVANAERVTITPRPGRLNNPQSGCVTVRLKERTTFKIVARGADRSITDSLVVVPESPVAAPAAPEVIPAKPEPKALVNSRLPNVRDRWTYRVRGQWASSPRRTIEVSALSVNSDAVEELLSQVEAESRKTLAQRHVRGPVAYMTQSPILGTEFSPYLAAFGGVDSKSSWKGIPTPDTNNFWTKWYSTGEVEGHESVTVPAGTFDAIKLEIWSARTASGSQTERDSEPVRIQYNIWYAAEIKRYVKMVRTTTAASGQRMNTDTFELVAYRQQ